MSWTFRPRRRCIRMIVTESYSDSASKRIRTRMESSIWRSVLAGEPARAVQGFHRHDVVIRIMGFIAKRRVAALQVDDTRLASVDEMVRSAADGLGACAHAG